MRLGGVLILGLGIRIVVEEEDRDADFQDREEEKEVIISCEYRSCSTDSEPDRDSENVSMRHLSWWQDRSISHYRREHAPNRWTTDELLIKS